MVVNGLIGTHTIITLLHKAQPNIFPIKPFTTISTTMAMEKTPPTIAQIDVKMYDHGFAFSVFRMRKGLKSYTRKTPGRPESSPLRTCTFLELSVTAYWLV